MEDIYKLCDKIVANKVLTMDALNMTLSGIAKGGRARYKTSNDIFYSRAQAMNYRARKKGAVGKVSPKELKDLSKKQTSCVYCGRKEDLVFDHIVSLYKGGTNNIENVQVLCSKCNMEKGVS